MSPTNDPFATDPAPAADPAAAVPAAPARDAHLDVAPPAAPAAPTAPAPAVPAPAAPPAAPAAPTAPAPAVPAPAAPPVEAVPPAASARPVKAGQVVVHRWTDELDGPMMRAGVVLAVLEPSDPAGPARVRIGWYDGVSGPMELGDELTVVPET